MRRLLCAIALLCAADAVAASSVQDATSAEELARNIAEGMSAEASFETLIEVSITGAWLPGEAPMVPEDSWLIHHSIHSVYTPDQYWQEIETTGRTTPEAPPDPVARTVQIWDGAALYHRVDGDRGMSIRAKAAPGDTHSLAFIFNGVEENYPSSPPLSKLIREGKTLSQRIHDGVIEHEFTASWDDRVTYTVVGDVGPPFRLRKVRQAVVFSETQKAIQEFVVEDWKRVGEAFLPHRGHVSMSTWGQPGARGDCILAAAKYERKLIKAIPPDEIDESLFANEFQPGEGGYDERLNMSFQLGSRTLVLDGVVYELAEPLTEHPEQNLGTLLKTATVRGQAEIAEEAIPTKPASIIRRILLACAFVFAAVLVAVTVRHIWRTKRGAPQ